MKSIKYQEAARLLLAQGYVELAAGDVRQASEKGWGAAAQMVKAVAGGRGWRHNSHTLLLRETGDQSVKPCLEWPVTYTRTSTKTEPMKSLSITVSRTFVISWTN